MKKNRKEEKITFTVFIEKKNPCIIGPMQFKPKLFKDQKYILYICKHCRF